MKLLIFSLLAIFHGIHASDIFMIWIGREPQPDSFIQVRRDYISIHDEERRQPPLYIHYDEIKDVGAIEQRYIRRQKRYFRTFNLYCEDLKVTIAGYQTPRLYSQIIKNKKDTRPRRKIPVPVFVEDRNSKDSIGTTWDSSTEFEKVISESSSIFSDNTEEEKDLFSETLPSVIVNKKEGLTCNLM